ncbi:Acetyltransferase (GNAT) domain-containing protein [Amycolatopsis xylanica]|uniref:Acetyltransferase (GNAT) domain-containing protein n=1 Tax=Amycolatopsis xylanica TaxID=589385 RepID=A0A1H3P9M1_9PSEU|nr:GNAT family N-acetyltransferase [Amycolatopsis xylanica]SDY97787.1 Acetyltransferase (GNAT) domain-containing protein [Amycolatopsis xylanica]
MSEIRLRPAEPHEADAITALARRSKAHWGYSQEFLDRVRDILVVHPEQIHDDRVVVADRDGALLGFYRIDGKPPSGELADLFLDPASIGTGLGRRLWEHALAAAKAQGFESLDLEADPNAEPFYLHMGAERTGEIEVYPGRSLPVMTVSL